MDYENRYKNMIFTAKEIGVDAGMIMVADMDYLNDLPTKDKPENMGQVFDIPVGTYRVRWGIDETYEGNIEGENDLVVTSGKVFVVDPCYVIGILPDEWGKWLDKTEYGMALNSDSAFIIDQMGGDGEYNIDFEFIPVE